MCICNSRISQHMVSTPVPRAYSCSLQCSNSVQASVFWVWKLWTCTPPLNNKTQCSELQTHAGSQWICIFKFIFFLLAMNMFVSCGSMWRLQPGKTRRLKLQFQGWKWTRKCESQNICHMSYMYIWICICKLFTCIDRPLNIESTQSFKVFKHDICVSTSRLKPLQSYCRWHVSKT